MTVEELEEFHNTNQQLKHWEQLGIIKELKITKGNSLATSTVNFKVDEEMLPLILKDNNKVVH